MKFDFQCPIPFDDLKKNHCELCSKTLTDCRDKSEEEIRLIREEVGDSFCGIFKKSSVQNLQSSSIRASFRLAFAAVFLFGLGCADLIAQETTQFENIIAKDTNQDSVVVSGLIQDVNGEAIPFVKIICATRKGEYFYGISDFDGNYRIVIPKSLNKGKLELRTSFVGYASETKELKVKSDIVVNFILEQTEVYIIGSVLHPNVNIQKE